MAIGDDVVKEGLNLCEGETVEADPTPAELETTGKLKEIIDVKVVSEL